MNTPKRNSHSLIEVIEYNSKKYKEYTTETTKKYNFRLLGDIPEGNVRWINIDGQCSEEVLNKISDVFNIHPLVTKNILNNNQRAKIEEYEDFLYIVAKMIYYSGDELVLEHIRFILGKNYVISFGETKGDVFDDIRDKIRNEGTQIRKFGADYLMYSLLDAIVDGYLDVLEVLDEKIDTLEEQVIMNNSQERLYKIRKIKKILLNISKYIWPLREVTSLMGKESNQLIQPSTEPYIRDVYEHIAQAIETTETYREILTGLMELYVSNTSYKLNEIMKVLTIISTIFIPLTFIVGVYGMNFRYMPEIEYRWGYAITWAIMIAISSFMVYYFKKKKWF
ncbi:MULTISPECIES: magnesium/cobalt transporter CorA [Tissierellales]|nr:MULTISPECIES: magnesium/cobalt transporter CorA [Tissierellales]SCL94692.1 Magnesium transport protein CorA [Sporanaerobacter sp. PP17-6a]